MIKSLPADVRARLRSGVAICSFGQCVEELLLNSIDARATCVAVRVDMEAFRIQVVDNGTGMGKDDVELVGTRYFTSKCHSVGDLENLTSSGFRGEALSSIANMASLVEVLSKTNKSTKTFTKLFQNGKALEVCEAEVNRPSGGTTVTVCNLFYNLPVRRRCLDNILELERTRQKVEAISLMYPSISFSLRNDASGSMLLQLPKSKDVSSRFCQIYGLSKFQKLRAVHFEYGSFAMNGYISCEGHYNKNMQYLFVNKRLILKTKLHKLINFLLRKESVICKPKAGPTGRQMSPSKHRTGPELYGIYVVNICCSNCEYDVCLEPAKTLIEFRNWCAVLHCIEEGVKTFLNRECLFIEPSSEDIQEFNEKNDFILTSTDLQLGIPGGKTGQERFKEMCGTVIDSFELTNLKSKDVLRKASKKIGLLNTLTPVNSEVTQEPANKKLYDIVSDDGETRLSGFSEPAYREVEKTISDTQKEFVLEAGEVEIEKRSKATKGLDPSTEYQTDVFFCKEARSNISEQEGCVLVHTPVEEGTTKSVIVVETVGSPVISNNDQEMGEGAGRSHCGPENVIEPSLLESTAMEMCDVGSSNVRSHRGVVRCRESKTNVDSMQAKLCSSSLIAPFDCKPVKGINQMHNSPHSLDRLGPISAQDIFMVNESISKDSQSLTNSSVGFANECTVLHRQRLTTCSDFMSHICGRESSGHDSKCGIYETLPFQDSHPTTFAFSTLNRDLEECSFQCSANKSTFSKPRACRKLSLFAQLGSLEKFRRWCGKVKTPPSTSSTQDKMNGNLTAGKLCSTAHPENTVHLKRSGLAVHGHGISHTADPESNVAVSLVPETNTHQLDTNTQLAAEDSTLCHESVRDSPLTLLDYANSKKPAIVNKVSLEPLAAKLSKMKGDQKGRLAQESEGGFQGACLNDSNSNVKCEHLLGPESNGHGCQKCQLLYDCKLSQKAGDSPSSRHTTENSGNYCKGTEGLNKQSMIVNTSTEYVSKPSLSLTTVESKQCSGVECENVCSQAPLLDPNLKATEITTDSLSNIWNDSTTFTLSENVNEDPKPCISDWLQRYDVSLGRLVYINTATGLSSYSAPVEERHASCTKDLTTLAVNVVSGGGLLCLRSNVIRASCINDGRCPNSNKVLNTVNSVGAIGSLNSILNSAGFQHWCHPFRSDLLLPFLPRPREERNMTVQQHTDVASTMCDEESVGSLLLEWENPVFAHCPQVAVDVSSGEATSLAVKIHNILYPYRFTKEMIHSMKVIQQVDNKFVACLLKTNSDETTFPDGNLLVLVDQHAAHERVRLEKLIADSYESTAEGSGKRKLLSSTVHPPLKIALTEEHWRLLRSYQSALHDVGLGISFPEDTAPHVLVGKVPLCFIEREANETRRGRPTVTKAIVEELIREEIEMFQTAGGARGVLPLTVMKVLASQACHGAIKFNERLSVEECCCLMESLSWCRLPFQCAHGRPAMLPLADVDHLELQKPEVQKPNLSKLRKEFRAWQRFGQQEQLTISNTDKRTLDETSTNSGNVH